MSDKQLQKLNKTQAIEVAHRMKNRAKTIRANAEKLTERLVHGAIGTAAGFGMGYWMGQAEADYQDSVTKWLADNPDKTQEDAEKEVDDPRKWGGVDKDLVVSGALAVAALTNMGGRKVTPFIEAAAFGGLAGWAYNRGMDAAIDGSEDDEKDDDDEEE